MAVNVMLGAVRFESPGYLVLLGLLPLIVLLSLRSLAGLGRVRRSLAIAFRCAVVICLVMALAGLQRVRSTDDLSVIFVVDRSNSIPRDLQQSSFDVLRDANSVVDPRRDRFGIVAFNGASAVEQLPMSALGIDRLSDPPLPDQTNLAAALRMATALFTEDARRRIVLLSDGNENVGRAFEEADQLGAARVPIDVVPLMYEHREEVVFERLSAPPTASSEETINLQMVLRAQQATTGKVLLYHNDELVDLDPAGSGAGYAVRLDPGPNRLQIPIPLRVAGAHRFRAVFEPDHAAGDSIVANNEGRAFTVVSGQGRILLLTTASDLSAAHVLARALEAEKLVCDVELAGEKALDQVRLLEYACVILSNVARNYLPEEVDRALAVYVRDLGGGLIMLGGDEAFGAGGWMGSTLEEVMPVSFDVKAKKQIPKGALTLVMHACEIPEGNFWGERVAIESVKTLSTRDLIGILQYQWQSTEKGYWLVPLREVQDKAAIIQIIRQMDMGDLPDLDALMRPGVEAMLQRPDAAAKHMIIVSDFDPAPPRDDLIKTMQNNKITCSTVAIGFGGHPIDVNKAKWIAQSTGGKYYATNDPQKLPQIFIKESQIVRRSLIHEIHFNPRLASGASPIIAAGATAWPALDGYVLTTAKPLALIPLVRDTEDGQDPILAHWQVGLGKSVAFTSGMWNRWGTQWAAWPGFGKTWAQIVRWASRQSAAAAFDVSTSVEGGKGRVRIDALDKNASALNFMTIQGNLIDPEQRSSRLQLTQTGPGTYEGDFDVQGAGSYIFNLAYQLGAGADAARGTLQTGVSVAYSPEFRELTPNQAFLAEVASRSGGGRVLGTADTQAMFDRTSLPPAEKRSPIWEDLVRLMLLLFLLDVAIRRIAINPAELVRKLRRRIAELGAAPGSAEESAATLATLRGARQAVRAATPSETGAAPDRPARYEPPVPDSKVTEQLSQALGGASELNAPVVARPTRKPTPQDEAGYTSRLLKAKRQARDDMGQKETKDE